MKKLLLVALVASAVLPIFAQETSTKEEIKQAREERRRANQMWPAVFAVCEFPASPDIVGLRLTIPFSTKQDNVSGIDLGLWGRALYFEGLQLNVLRNDVKDDAAAFQVSLYNSVGGGNMLGFQAGLWNEAGSMVGFQAGLINLGCEVQGLQIGLINRAETMHGYQIGLINIIRDAELQFFPGINIGF